ncbi:MAG: EVE domain-containing protein [Bacteroidia bacterium]|nr:EVE domain-containing protein [Bacteroidia bacterium]
MNYWLIKSEPSAYSWEQFKKDKKTDWTGVRNYAARNNLRAMKKGDLAFFYHSNEGQEIVGIAKVTKEHFPDKTAKEGDWSAVEFAPYKDLKTPVGLTTLKKDPFFKNMDLVRLGRLSTGKVTETEFFKICDMGGVKL